MHLFITGSVFTCTVDTLVHAQGNCVKTETEQADIAGRGYSSQAALQRLKPDDQQSLFSVQGGPFLLLTATIFNIYSGLCIYLIFLSIKKLEKKCRFLLGAGIAHHQN